MARRKSSSPSSRRSSTRDTSRPALEPVVSGCQSTAAQALSLAGLIPLVISYPGGERLELSIPASEQENYLLVAAANNQAMDRLLRQQAASGRPTRRPSTARFRRGLVLLTWIDSPLFGRGKLTKELVTEIKDGCKDWPEVIAYIKHNSREKLRNSLRSLAEDTRRALREERLPAGWGEG
jgi:hypothetical protein